MTFYSSITRITRITRDIWTEMKLAELLRDLPVLHAGADATLEVSSLAYNSREVRPGTLFFAIQGEKADGHVYIPQALERGAVAVVSERPAPPELAVAMDSGGGHSPGVGGRGPNLLRSSGEAPSTYRNYRNQRQDDDDLLGGEHSGRGRDTQRCFRHD